MLLNDSFLLPPPTPTLWNCHGVCGLAWTAPPHDPSRHFQSYLRVLSPCALEAFRRFVGGINGGGPQRMTNVQDVIQRLEVNLSWARETRNEEVRALFEYAGGHPDEDAIQRKLVGEGYPAIKLKKFFETEDPWLRHRLAEEEGGHGGEEEEGGRRVSPALDLEVYRKKNHDLNHLSDQELEEHFANYGWRENRIYSRLPLVMKGWLREELENLPGKRGEEVIAILEDYLTMLNKGI
ncbi:hypothetical protein HJC23_001590 [Cyclotella cryptica]|uniref:Uncharacterized protein n=1 Tax=Cyclotella cryptica TaxID=29204 RepID=A0ABD3NZ35_9STRA